MKKRFLPLIAASFLVFGLSACWKPVDESNNDAEVAVTQQALYDLSGLDSCVTGTWTMDVFAINNKFQELEASPFLHVVAPSLLTMEFRSDNTFALFGPVTMRFDIPGGSDYIEMNATHTAQGGYSANGSIMSFVGVDHDIIYGTGQAYIDGEMGDATSFLESLGVDAFTAPVVNFPVEAGYICNGSTMILDSLGYVTEEWTR
jgi:hypothetical protein